MPERAERWRWDQDPTPEQLAAAREEISARPLPILPSSQELVAELRALASEPFAPFPSPFLPPERPISPANFIDVVEEIAVFHGIDLEAFWRMTYADVRLAVRARANAEAGKLAIAAVLARAPTAAGDVPPPSLADLKAFLASDDVRGLPRSQQRRACRAHFALRPVSERLFRAAIAGENRPRGRRKQS